MLQRLRNLTANKMNYGLKIYTLGFLSQSHIRGEEGGWQMKFKPLWLADLSPWPQVLVIRVKGALARQGKGALARHVGKGVGEHIKLELHMRHPTRGETPLSHRALPWF